MEKTNGKNNQKRIGKLALDSLLALVGVGSFVLVGQAFFHLFSPAERSSALPTSIAQQLSQDQDKVKILGQHQLKTEEAAEKESGQANALLAQLPELKELVETEVADYLVSCQGCLENYMLKANTLEHEQIKAGQVRSEEIKDRTIRSRDLARELTIQHLVVDHDLTADTLTANDLTIKDELNLRSMLTVGEATTTHELANRGDVLIGGKLEVDGAAYFDSTITVRDASNLTTAIASQLTSDRLITQTANISNILSNSNLKIKGRLPDEDTFTIDDFVSVTLNPSGIVSIGEIPNSFVYIDGANDLFIADDIEVAGTIYGTIAGAYSPSGDLDMDNHLISNIGAAGTDFTSSGGLNLVGNLNVNAGQLFVNTISGNVGIGTTSPGARLDLGTLNLNGQKGISYVVSADNDGETVYGSYNSINVGSGILSTGNRTVYGSFTMVTNNADSEGGWNYSPYAAGAYYKLDGRTNAATGKFLTGVEVVSPWESGWVWSGNNTTQTGFRSALQVGGSGSHGLGVQSRIDMDSEVSPVSQNSYSFQGTIGKIGSTDNYYGLAVDNIWDAWVTGGNIYGYYFDIPAAGATNKYAIYTVQGTNYFGGNVGIGATNPGYALEVNGTVLLGPPESSMGTLENYASPAQVVITNNDSKGMGLGVEVNSPVNYGMGIFVGARGPGRITGIGGDSYATTNNGTAWGVSANAGVSSIAGITASEIAAFHAWGGYVGDGAAVTNNYGIKIDNQTVGANNYAIHTNETAGTNNYALYNAGTAKSYFAGNVGIGTTSPQYKLDVSGNVNANFYYGAAAYFNTTWITDGLINVNKIRDYSGGNLSLQDDAGNVGIGTTSPGAKLSVQATGSEILDLVTSNNIGRFRVDSVNNSGLEFTHGSSIGWVLASYQSSNFLGGNYDFTIFNEYIGSDAFAINGSTNSSYFNGNVGIGTTGPGEKLEVNGSVLASSYKIGGATILSGSVNVQLGSTGSTGTFSLANTGGSRLYIQSDGNVGIGTTSPGSTLTVSGAIDNTMKLTGSERPALFFDTTSALKNWAIVTNKSGYNALDFYASTADNGNAVTAGTSKLTIQSNGNVGIGTTSPGAKLDLYGASVLSLRMMNSNDPDFYFQIDQQYNSTDSTVFKGRGGKKFLSYQGANTLTALKFFTEDTERMRIDNNGNVGIGTTSANYKLDIDTGSHNAVALQTRGKVLIGQVDRNAVVTIANRGSVSNIGLVVEGAFGQTGNLFEINSLNNTGGNLLSVLSTGNVGIGTTSPNQLLHIYKSGLSDAITNINGNGSYLYLDSRAQYSTIDFKLNGSDEWKIGQQGGNSFNIYEDSSTARVTIRNGGNVGIGTTSPNEKLEVNGNVKATALRLGDTGLGALASGTDSSYIYQSYGVGGAYPFDLVGHLVIQSRSNANRDIVFVTGSTSSVKMVINNTGNVGIGTTAPGYNLEVVRNDDAGIFSLTRSGVGSSYFRIGNLGGGNSNLRLHQTGAESNFQYMGSSSTALVTFFSNGNVGIGTTAPGAKLEVNGRIIGSGINSVGGTTLIKSANGANNFRIVVGDNYDATLSVDTGSMLINDDWATLGAQRLGRSDLPWGQLWVNGLTVNNGNVGIGTTNPTNKLVVAGTTAVGNTTDGLWLSYGDGGGAIVGLDNVGNAYNNIDLRTSATPLMTLTTGGNVGIGTTGPGAKLHVAGDVAVSQNIKMSGGSSFLTYDQLGGTEYTKITTYNGGNASINIGTKHSLGYISFESGNGAYTERMRITNTGNVGIGTTNPSRILDVIGNIQASDAIYAGGGSVYMNAAGFTSPGNWSLYSASGVVYVSNNDDNLGRDLVLRTRATERMRINSEGNVGIGTTGPNYKLDVNGGVRSNSADVYLTGLTTGDGTALYVTAGNQVVKYSSSLRYKHDIQNYSTDYLDRISLLKPVRFKWNEDTATPNKDDFGLIAEEVYQVLPELVKKNSEGQIESVDYSKISVVLIGAVQELNKIQGANSSGLLVLGKEQADLESQLEANKTQITSIETTLDELTVSFDAFNSFMETSNIILADHEQRLQTLESQINVAGDSTELEMPEILDAWSDILELGTIEFDTEGNLKVKKLETGFIQLNKNENPPACSAEIEGAFYYNFAEKAFFGCDGESWKKMGFTMEEEPEIP